MRIDETLSLSIYLCLATARFDCQVAIYSPAIPFNRDAILLGDGIERKGACIHRREVRGRSAWRTKKKREREERQRKKRRIYIYTHTHTKHCSILIKARNLADIANRDETSPLSPFVATFDCDVARLPLPHCRENKVTMLMISGLL